MGTFLLKQTPTK